MLRVNEGVSAILAGSLPPGVVSGLEGLWSDASRQEKDPVVVYRSPEDSSSTEKSEPTEGSQPKSPEDERVGAGQGKISDDAKESAMQQDEMAEMGGDSVPQRNASELIATRTRKLEAKTEELRIRVAAAQNALDERAKNYQQGLMGERRLLEKRQTDLRRQAEVLLAAGRNEQRDEARGEAAASPKEQVIDQDKIERLLSGQAHVDLASTTNSTATDEELSESDVKTLEDRVAELIEVANSERQEIERGEALIESLRFETERQRTMAIRRQEKLCARESSLAERFRALNSACDEIEREKVPLVERLQELDVRDKAVKARVLEAERIQRELDSEGSGLERSKEVLESKQRELLAKLERERHRLQVRQAELHHKAAELVKAAREKRLSVESEAAAQQAELKAREAELRARRAEIEKATRSELERTACDLEQVLNVRLSDIEEELRSRKAYLDAHVEKLATPSASLPMVGDSRGDDSIEAPLRRVAAEFAATGIDMDDCENAISSLDALEEQINALGDVAGVPSRQLTGTQRERELTTAPLAGTIDKRDKGLRMGATDDVSTDEAVEVEAEPVAAAGTATDDQKDGSAGPSEGS